MDETGRQLFIRDVNEAFSAQAIEGTAERLRALSHGADFLDMVHVLGFLRWVTPGDFARYRQRLPIPPLVMRILTETFRAALQHAPRPMPIQFGIVEGPAEGVSVTVHPDRFDLVLTRTSFDPLRRPPGRDRTRPGAGRAAAGPARRATP